ncbi:uncharacterized protein LOC134232691 [Saccostrea cucullata]|uniref:uncharacterized protein LOC134232691 n=1 Tax=Saccostrea cuccullata TaxID=36930 RepID=UPI002ED69A44
MEMSGSCSKLTRVIFILLLGKITIHVDSRIYMKEKRFTRNDVCMETEATIEDVFECPITEESMKERSARKRCEEIRDVCAAEKLVYHCVRYKNKLIEVCAPRNYITGQCCVQFNEGVARIVEDYSVPCSECPFHYFSNDSLFYNTCLYSVESLAAIKNATKTIADTTSTSTLLFDAMSTKCRYASGRRKGFVNCSQYVTATHVNTADYIPNTGRSDNNLQFTGSSSGIGIIIGILSFFVFVCIAAAVACCIWKGKSDSIVNIRSYAVIEKQRRTLLENEEKLVSGCTSSIVLDG